LKPATIAFLMSQYIDADGIIGVIVATKPSDGVIMSARIARSIRKRVL
jgi:hypothetical protein